MKNTLLYTVSIALLFGIAFGLNYFTKKEFTWDTTYSQYDKQPFGAYAFDKLLSESWEGEYLHNYKSISQLVSEDMLADQNLLIVADNFSSYKEEVDKLLDYVSAGHQVMIAADRFDGALTDTLGFESEVQFLLFNYIGSDIRKISKRIRFCSDPIKERKYKFPSVNITTYFNKVGKANVVTVAENEEKKPIMLRYPIGKGNLIVACNPKVFTNYSILDEQSKGFVLLSLAYLKGASLMRTEYYHMGSEKSTSPFRYLMNNKALRWAFLLTVASILLFMIFTAKRKQKAIPVLKEPENRMLSFIRSIAALYLRRNNNADIVRKKYTYWGDHLKREYGLDIINRKHDIGCCDAVATKTGHPVDEIRSLFQALDQVTEDVKISDKEMVDLVRRMDLIH